MKLFFKIIFATLLLALLVSCGQKTPALYSLEAQEAKIDELNKKLGGLGINYNYNAPNKNPSQTVTPLE